MTRESKLADAAYREQERRLGEETETGAAKPKGESAGTPAKAELGPPVDADELRRAKEIIAKWVERPLDVDQVEALIFELDGDVRLIAKRLSVRSDRLRAFIMASGTLRRALDEVYEGAVDEAIGVLFRGLRDEVSFQNRFYAAKEWLRSGAGHKRGFGQAPSPHASLEIKDSTAGRTIVLKWLEPDPPKALPPGRDPGVIEGEKAP